MKTRVWLLFAFTFIFVYTGCFAQNLDTQKLDSLFSLIEGNNKGMGSVSVFRDGKEIYQRGYGFANVEKGIKPDAETVYRIGSITKTFTAAIILKLIEQGKLSLDTKLSKFYPQIKNAGSITVDQLLHHRSGIFNFTATPDYLQWYNLPQSKQMLLDRLAAFDSNFEPDSKFEYSNSNYMLLTFIAEDAGGKPYDALLKEYITGPCGLKHTRIFDAISAEENEAASYSYFAGWVPEKETDCSVPLGAGALASTPANLNRFIVCLAGGKVVNAESVKLMTTMKDNYGMGLVPYKFKAWKGFGHDGGIDGFQSSLFFMPDLNMAVAIVSNGTLFRLSDIAIGILSVVTGDASYMLPVFTEAVKLDAADLEKYAGDYSSTQIGLKVKVFVQEGALFAQATGQPSFPLECFGTDKFRFETAGVVMEFVPAEKKMVLLQQGAKFTFTRQ